MMVKLWGIDRGLLELVRRSGKVTTVVANPVYEKDTFEIEFGDKQKLKHVPYLEGDRGNIKLFYAYAFGTNGEFYVVDPMTKAEMDKHRDQYSQSKDSGPWVTEYIEMGKKTMLKALCKVMPMSIELQKAIAADDTVKTAIASDMSDVISDIDYTVDDSLQGAETQVPQEN